MLTSGRSVGAGAAALDSLVGADEMSASPQATRVPAITSRPAKTGNTHLERLMVADMFMESWMCCLAS